MPAPLLEVEDLQIEFGQPPRRLRAVDQVSFQVAEGETLCLVGESGSGKTVTALSIARLLPVPPAHYAGGVIRLLGHDMLKIPTRELRDLRGGAVSYVFQEPSASLNPVFRIGRQIRESLRLHRPEAATEVEVVRLLKLVGIPAAELRQRDYPHQLSGGMQQRVMIAMAIASRPRLLIADEPTTALDVTIQAQILELLRRLKDQFHMSILLITHNLGIVADIADRMAVMYAGQIVEAGPAEALLRQPAHPYTRALLRSVPKLGSHERRLMGISGQVPTLGNFPSGCRFHPRCDQAQADCSVRAPAWCQPDPHHAVRCPYWNLAPTDRP